MIITHYGLQSFKVQFGNTILAFNPVSKNSKNAKPARFAANISLISLNHPDFNGSEQNAYADKAPMIISGPGEYEVQGIVIKGFPSKSHYESKEDLINTIYFLQFDGMRICFLGPIDDANITDEANEAIEDIDVLFVPIGGAGMLDPARASKLAASLEPRLIIPMHYDKQSLSKFLKESGEDSVTPQDKLTIKKKDVMGKEGEVVVLKPSA